MDQELNLTREINQPQKNYVNFMSENCDGTFVTYLLDGTFIQGILALHWCTYFLFALDPRCSWRGSRSDLRRIQENRSSDQRYSVRWPHFRSFFCFLFFCFSVYEILCYKTLTPVVIFEFSKWKANHISGNDFGTLYMKDLKLKCKM